MSMYIGKGADDNSLLHITSGTDSLATNKSITNLYNTVFNSRDTYLSAPESHIVEGIEDQSIAHLTGYPWDFYKFHYWRFPIPGGGNASRYVPILIDPPITAIIENKPLPILGPEGYGGTFGYRGTYKIDGFFFYSEFDNDNIWFCIFDVADPLLNVGYDPNRKGKISISPSNTSIPSLGSSIDITSTSFILNNYDIKKHVFPSVSSTPNEYDIKASIGGGKYMQILNEYSVRTDTGGIAIKNDGIHALVYKDQELTYPIFAKGVFNKVSISNATFSIIYHEDSREYRLNETASVMFVRFRYWFNSSFIKEIAGFGYLGSSTAQPSLYAGIFGFSFSVGRDPVSGALPSIQLLDSYIIK